MFTCRNYLKHRATAVATGYDNEVTDAALRNKIMDVVTRLQQKHPTWSKRTQISSVGKLELPCNWTDPCVKWGNCEGCLLLVSRKWYPTHKYSSWTLYWMLSTYLFSRKQPDCIIHRVCMFPWLDIIYTFRKGQNSQKGFKWDVHSEEDHYLGKVNRRIGVICGQ